MTAINIFNKRTYARKDHPESKAFYCGRRMRDIPGSPLANPFKIQSGRLARVEAIYKYSSYFRDMLGGKAHGRNEFMQSLADIILVYESGVDVDLVCWCSPDDEGRPVACHCDIIRDYILKVTSL